MQHQKSAEETPSKHVPQSLPNGIMLPRKYQRLLSYFVDDILPSLSCHPCIHEDLCRGLVPVMIRSPQLMSASLALSAAGALSRGIQEIEGVDLVGMLGHLQTLGLSLLRNALATGQSIEIMLATCLIWCLTDVFTYRKELSSWRIHLQGMRALLNRSNAYRDFIAPSSSMQLPMRHLYQLYLSLQTLPHIPALNSRDQVDSLSAPTAPNPAWLSMPSPGIDGFLGYSNELLDILHRIDELSRFDPFGGPEMICEADILLGKLTGMITRDTTAPPDILICMPLSPEYSREFTLCHQTFQQATLIHLYRRLYHLPSGSQPIQEAVSAIEERVGKMIQGKPCHTWVAMAMPLFTLACEAFTDLQRGFVADKINKLNDCIGSLHVKSIQQAAEDVWKLREALGDVDGGLCSSQLLGE